MTTTGPAPASAGIVTALVGFTGSFVVILTGLHAVGATDGQAASGLLGLCLVVGASTLWLALRHRVPVTTAWSTPGGAVLGTAGHPPRGSGTPSAHSSSAPCCLSCPG